MVSTNDLKNGMTIVFENNIYQVLEFMHVKPGKGHAFVTSKLRNLRTGSVIDKTFNAGVKLEKAIIDKKDMQYIYFADNYVFMDSETYEQIEIAKEQIADEAKYIKEGMTVTVIFYGTEILGVSLPDKVTLSVTKCDPAVKGDTKTNALKDAELETGLVVKVPMFVNEGDSIVVSTVTGKYDSRA